MNELMFKVGNHVLLAEAGGEGGGGGASGGDGAGGGSGGNGGEGGAGGAGGGAGGTGSEGNPPAGAFSGTGDGGSGDGSSDGQSNGALNKDGNGTGDGEIAWDKITDAELFGKVKMPEIEGVKIDSEFAAKRYGEFCRKHHISPEAIAEFMKIEGDGYAEAMKAGKASTAKRAAEVQANFDAQGKELHEKFTPEQIGVAISTLKNSVELNGDKDFMQVVTGPMSNNKTIVALLLNWAETHKGDQNTGAGAGSGGNAEQGFAARWTGQKI